MQLTFLNFFAYHQKTVRVPLELRLPAFGKHCLKRLRSPKEGEAFRTDFAILRSLVGSVYASRRCRCVIAYFVIDHIEQRFK